MKEQKSLKIINEGSMKFSMEEVAYGHTTTKILDDNFDITLNQLIKKLREKKEKEG